MEHKDVDNSLISLTTEAIDKLELAMRSMSELDRKEGYSLGKIGRAIGIIKEFQQPILEKNQNLKPQPPEDYVPDSPLTPEQKDFVKNLRIEDLEIIDKTILKNACNRWRKVARIVGVTMKELPEPLKNIPENYYPERLACLVEAGKLELQGDLAYMRFSEVRIPAS